MADLITSNTQMTATKQDLIATLIQRELKQAAKLTPFFTDVSQFAVKGAQSISFPKLTSLTAVDRANGAAMDSVQLTSSIDKLSLNLAPYIAYIVDPQDAIESVLDWDLAYAQRAASGHGRFVDTAIITELEAVGVPTGTAGAISEANILAMRLAYVKNFGIMSESVLMVAPDEESVMLGIADFIRADAYGSSNVPDGVIGKVYGLQVVVHNGLAAGQFFVAGKSGLAYGFQQGITMSEQGANQYGAAAKRVAIDQKLGVKGLEIAQAGVSAGLSALVIKDNN